jgi:hypothetical protein
MFHGFRRVRRYQGMESGAALRLRDKHTDCRHLRLMFFTYKPNMWYWQVCEFARTIVFMSFMFMLSGSAIQITIGLVVCFLCFGVYGTFPF